MPSFRNRPIDIILDVRTRVEFWFGHLPGAIQISVDDLDAELPRREEIKPEHRILVYCASGARCAQAAGLMRRLGYRHVVDGGGLAAARAEFATD